jgi:hypothetical protein
MPALAASPFGRKVGLATLGLLAGTIAGAAIWHSATHNTTSPIWHTRPRRLRPRRGEVELIADDGDGVFQMCKAHLRFLRSRDLRNALVFIFRRAMSQVP